MDQVLREALCLSDPDSLFGSRIRPMEYRQGKLVEAVREDDDTPGVPAPTAEPPGAQQ
jgi:hypothetical protein